MKPWVVWALTSVVAWGLWGLFSAKAAQSGSAHGLLAGAVLMEGVFVLPYVGQIPRSLSWWLVGVGAAGALAYFGLFRALSLGGPPGTVVAVTAMYPAVTAALAVPLLGDGMTLRKGVGIAMAIGAAVVVSWE